MRSRKAAAAGLVIVALTGCGGGDDEPAGTPEDPVPAQRDPADVNEGSPPATTAPAPKPGFADLVDQQRRNRQGERFSPCELVLRAEASAILGRAVRQPIEAQQGPTCIYAPARGAEQITVTVQVVSFDRVARRLRRARRVTLGSRPAVCGFEGRPVLHLRLAARRVLTINARCPVARRFATRALPRLRR